MTDDAASIVRGALHHPRLTLLPSDEQCEMRDAVRAFLAGAIPAASAEVAEWTEVDPDGSLWRRMAQEIGLQGLTVPEHLDGQGFGMAEAAIVFEELGRALCAAPLLGTMALAGRVLHHAGSTGEQMAADIASGALRATGALDSAAQVTARDADGPRLTGTVLPLIDGACADLVIVAARHPAGVGVYAVEPGDDLVERSTLAAVDLTRSFARLVLDDTPARQLIAPGEADAALARARHESVILLAAESVGAARRSLESTVDYARTREQFGQPIGSFQALKHRMADILVAIERAWSAVRYAAILADLVDEVPGPGPRDLALAASVARVASDHAFGFAAAECIQIHGGIGFTWEYSAHLAYRRSVSNRQLLGSPDEHRDALVRVLSSKED